MQQPEVSSFKSNTCIMRLQVITGDSYPSDEYQIELMIWQMCANYSKLNVSVIS